MILHMKSDKKSKLSRNEELIYSSDECEGIGRMILKICHELIDGDHGGHVRIQPIILHNGALANISIEQPYFTLLDEQGNLHKHYPPRRSAVYGKRKKV